LLGPGRNVGQDGLNVLGVASVGDDGEVAVGSDQREGVVRRAVAGAEMAAGVGELAGLMRGVDNLEGMQVDTGMIDGRQVAEGQQGEPPAAGEVEQPVLAVLGPEVGGVGCPVAGPELAAVVAVDSPTRDAPPPSASS
jgi:hypothetical protein